MTAQLDEPAPRADRGQPAARRAAPLHRDRAGRRQRRRDRPRRRPPDRPAEPRRAGPARRGRSAGSAGRPIDDVLPGVGGAARRGRPASRRAGRARSSPGPRQAPAHRCWCALAPQRDDGRTLGYVVTFDDITALLSAQRQAAWAEVARRIAHEVKNPLTPIRLSAERLERKYLPQIARGRGSPSQQSIATIIRQVDTIGRLISEFSAFARMPAPSCARTSRRSRSSREAVLLQQAAWPEIAVRGRHVPDAPVQLSCDGPKVSQALTNLLQNSVNALSEGQRPPPWDDRDPRCGGPTGRCDRGRGQWAGFPGGRRAPVRALRHHPGQGHRLGPCHRQEDHGGTRRHGRAARRRGRRRPGAARLPGPRGSDRGPTRQAPPVATSPLVPTARDHGQAR